MPNLRFVGEAALVQCLSQPRQRKKGGPDWQYHPRSDHHSKVSCLLMALDLLVASPWLCSAIQKGKFACGINHTMTDHRTKRKKAFDLVFHRPSNELPAPRETFHGLLKTYGVDLSPYKKLLDGLPDIPVHPVAAKAVYIAFEAKACMTEFGKARPRLFDELNSSHPTIHGDTENAIAAGLVLINAAASFISPLRNPEGVGSVDIEITQHKQPSDWESVVAKVRELPLRSGQGEFGFDAIGIIGVMCKNDGSPITLLPASKVTVDYEYESMITRVAHLAETRFGHLVL